MRSALAILMLLAANASADAPPPGSGPCDDPATCHKAWTRAAARYGRACTAGDAEACWRAGRIAESGRAGKVDRKRARALYDRACARKLVRGCHALADLDRTRGAKARDAALQRAIAIEAVACAKQRDAAACDRAVSALRIMSKSAAIDARIAKLTEQACIARTGSPCPPPRKCESEQVAMAAVTAAKAADDQRLAAALAAQKLQLVTLVAHRLDRDAVEDAGPPWRLDQVVSWRPGGRALKRVVVGHDWFSSGGGPASEYVRTGDKIHRVVRSPKTVSTKTIEVCGCQGLGGARPQQLTQVFELPDGTTFAGPVQIAYDEDKVVLRYQSVCAYP